MEIYVQPDKLKDFAQSCSSLRSNVASIESSFISVTNSLDWKVKSKANIQQIIRNLNTRLDNAEDALYKYKDFFNSAAEDYRTAEKNEQQESESLKSDLYKGNSNYNWTGDTNNSSEISTDNDESSGTNSDSSSDTTESAEEKSEGYIKKLIENYISKLIGEKNKTYSKNISFYGKYGVGFSFVTGIVNIASNIKGYYDKYINGIDSYAAFIADTGKTWLNSFNTWAGSVFTFDSYLKSLKSAKALENTGLQNFLKWVPVINVPLSFVTSYSVSRAEYSADGEYTRTEFARSVVDASVSGIFSVTNGFVNKIPGVGVWLNASVSAANSAYGIDDSISDGIVNWATDLSTRANDGSNSLSSAENVVYNALYGIGWAANNVLDFGENVATGVKNIISNIFN